MKNLKNTPKLALLLATSSASLVLLLEPIATKLILAAVSFAGVFRLARDRQFPKGLRRTKRQEPEQRKGGERKWFPY
jgi:hypothetical protein